MIRSRTVLFLASLFIWVFIFSPFSYSQQQSNQPPLPNPGKLLPAPGKQPKTQPPFIGNPPGLQPPDEEADEEARNPFLLPDGVYLKSTLVNEAKPEEPEGEPTLQAVTITKKNRIATINNFNFEVGDVAFGKKIVAISNDRVILENDAERITLTLKNRSFRIKVNKDQN